MDQKYDFDSLASAEFILFFKSFEHGSKNQEKYDQNYRLKKRKLALKDQIIQLEELSDNQAA